MWIARADDAERTPRAIHIGAVAGLATYSGPDQFDPTITSTQLAFISGFDVGVQHLKGGFGFSLDGDILPIGSIYRAHASVVLGHGFTTGYWEPCSAPPGYTCSRTWSGRRVRSIIGLKLGANFGYEMTDTTASLEAGIAFRSQISMDWTGVYDPIRGVPGTAIDVEWQIGPFYLGFDMHGLFSDREPVQLTASIKLGWAKMMWR
jgi:hypothetical protein